MKLLKLFQYAYILFAILFSYEAIVSWNVDRNKSYMSILLVALAVFMFFFRKKFRKKIEDRNKE